MLLRSIVIDFIKLFNYLSPPLNRRDVLISQNKLGIARSCHKEFMNTGPTDGERLCCTE
jgi:hypothetical protein